MLEVIRCPDPQAKRAFFANADAKNETWVVSDLQSKWHLQKELLNRNGCLEQKAVLRATELWRHLSFQLAPQLDLLSPELAQTLFWNWIQEMELPWARSPHAVPVVINQMQMWMSIFSDPNFEEIMSQWFKDNQESYVRWGHWFELCATIWRRCQEQDLVMVSWLPAFLLSEDLSRLQWQRPLTFDLGPQITQVEGQLIKELSRSVDVKVMYPEAPWINLMKNTLRPYEIFLGGPEKGDPEWQPLVTGSFSFGRFSTQLAEVKDAVAQARLWLDAGVEPQKIALVAPDIEEYWPALQMYLREEGIPACKPVSAKLGGFLETARWLSALRTVMAKISAQDLEVFFFTQRKSPKLPFDEFRVLFSQIYDSADLKRAAHLFEREARPDEDEALTMAEFLAWSLKFWDGDSDQTRLKALLQVIGQEVPRHMQLKPSQWLSYLEGVLARREIGLQPADETGIWCVSLSSADWLPATHGIFLNLNEGSLRSVENSPVSHTEGQRIFTDTGFAVGTTDRQELEFELLWFLQKKWEALRLCFSATDFQGAVLTPSRLWMWAGFVSDQLKLEPESPRVTLWDELQLKPLEELCARRGFTPERTQELVTALKRDVDATVNSWGQPPHDRISASSLERYWMCPFIFGAERRLKLSDEPVLDLDLDRRTRGTLLHAIVEKLCEEPFRADWSDGEIEELIESCRQNEEVRLGDERLWPAIRAQHIRLARQFLTFESSWRKKFPKTKTAGREIPFELPWGPALMSGRLDRVDTDSQGRYAVIDYKAGAGNLRNWKSWMDNHDIQLALYSLLVEQGKTSLPPAPVAAANYYVVKDMDRRKGFHLRDDEAELYENQGHRNFIGETEKAELYAAVQKLIDTAVEEIGSGKLNPNPEEEKICAGCSWRTLCRAPHLN